MKKTLLVMRQELINTFGRPSYLFFVFGIPLLAVLILVGVKVFQARSGGGDSKSSDTPTEFQIETEGYVDQSGLVQIIPEELVGSLIPFSSEEQAQTALATGEIAAFYIIPPDYVKSGNFSYVYSDTRSYLSDGQDWVMRWTLTLNLLEGDLELAQWAWNPIWNLEKIKITPQASTGTLSGEDCSRPGANCESNDLVRLMPSILVAIFYMTFMASSSMLFNSVGVEKENRTLEVLLLSINPRQLLAGKTMALGLAGLTQTAVWLGAIYFSFNLGGSTLNLPEGFTFPLNILAWGLIFFLGGFALYASLMAGAGAMVPKMKEAGVANFIAITPLLFGYIFGLLAPIVGATDSGFMVFLSLFPLTSPVVMIMRVVDTVVPLWQLLLAAGLLFGSAYYALWVVAAMFNAQNLLSGQPFSLKRYFQALTGRP